MHTNPDRLPLVNASKAMKVRLIPPSSGPWASAKAPEKSQLWPLWLSCRCRPSGVLPGGSASASTTMPLKLLRSSTVCGGAQRWEVKSHRCLQLHYSVFLWRKRLLSACLWPLRAWIECLFARNTEVVGAWRCVCGSGGRICSCRCDSAAGIHPCTRTNKGGIHVAWSRVAVRKRAGSASRHENVTFLVE